MKKSGSILSVYLGLLLTAASASRSVRFSLGSLSCSGGSFQNSGLSVVCNDDCSGGDNVSVSGTISATQAFNDDPVTLMACIMGYCPDQWSLEEGSICDWVTSTDGSDCGTQGTYTVSHEIDIPEEANDFSAYFTSLITIKAIIGDEDACEQSATAASLTYGVASLFCVSGLSLFYVRRRRKPLLVLEESNDNFVEMTDNGPSVLA